MCNISIKIHNEIITRTWHTHEKKKDLKEYDNVIANSRNRSIKFVRFNHSAGSGAKSTNGSKQERELALLNRLFIWRLQDTVQRGSNDIRALLLHPCKGREREREREGVIEWFTYLLQSEKDERCKKKRRRRR